MLESVLEASNIVRSVFYGEKDRSLLHFFRVKQNKIRPLKLCVTPLKGMPCIPAGGNIHGLSTPERYTEGEETKIHDTVPTRTSLRELYVGNSHIKRLLTELIVSIS